MQSSDIPSKIVLPFAQNATTGYKNTIPITTASDAAASFNIGFPPRNFQSLASGGIPPDGADVNGILNALSAWARLASAGGGTNYDANFAASTYVGGYPKGARVLRSDGGGYWRSRVDNNSANPESDDGTNWQADRDSGITNVALTNANVTLTNAQAANRFINATGAITATLNVILPTIGGMNWVVANNTTGGQNVNFKTAGGAGLQLAPGIAASVVCDGTNIISSATAIPDYSITTQKFAPSAKAPLAGNADAAANATNATNLVAGGTIAGTVTGVTQHAGSGGNTGSPIGTTWTGPGVAPSGASITVYDFLAVDSNTTLAATSSGLWKSTDRGDTWSTVTLPAAYGGGPIWSLYLIPGTTTVLLGTRQNSQNLANFWKSTDAGTTWTASTGITTQSARTIFRLGTKIFVGGYESGAATLFVSSDNGSTFTQTLSANGYPFSVVTFGNSAVLSLANGAGQRSLYRTEDGGVNWVDISANFSGYSASQALYRLNSGRILVANANRSIAYSDDNGTTWADLSGTPNLSTITGIGNQLWAANYSNLTIYTSVDGAITWTPVSLFTLGFQTLKAVDSATLLAGGYRAANGGIYKSIAVQGTSDYMATVGYVDNEVFGRGQNYTTYTVTGASPERSLGVPYTNTKPKAIFVTISASGTGAGTLGILNVQITINQVTKTFAFAQSLNSGLSTNTVSVTGSFIVPPDGQYTVTNGAGNIALALTEWTALT